MGKSSRFDVRSSKRKMGLLFAILYSLFTLFSSCGSDDEYTPRPSGYYRIEFPEKKYKTYDSICPFTFEYPVYAKVLRDEERSAEPCWINIDFPKLNGRLHLSYKVVNKNLTSYLNDTYELVSKHQVKASGIDEQIIKNDTAKVYGIAYRIKGNTASELQFYITDSTHNFVRGALYFNVAANGDSLAPVVDFISQDVRHFLNTFRWK